MSDTLLGSLRQMITPATISRLSSAYGDPSPAVEKGLAGAIAAVLAAITARAGNTDLMSQLLSFAKHPSVPGAPTDAPMAGGREFMLGPGAEGLVSRLQALFLGPGTSGLVNALAGHANLSRPTAMSLMGVASSMVLGQLARMVRRDNLDAASLGQRLAAEQASIRSVLPSALAALPALGGVPEGLLSAASRENNRAAGAQAAGRARSSTSLSWVAPLLFALAALVALVLLLRTRDQGDVRLSARDVGSGAVGTSGAITRVLPTGTELRFAPAGPEARFLDFVEGAPAADADGWFEFDRVSFESDSARLRTESQPQLSNIAAILKAYPAVHAKIGGYTDNSGEPAANRRLSQERADAVAAELRRHGVPGNRLEAEGFGDQHAVADNTTDEGRARNRRVAIRVTSR